MNRPLNDVEFEKSHLRRGSYLGVTRRFAMVAFACTSLIGGTISQALGQTPPITVSAVPASLALQPGRVATVILVVRNTSATPVRDVKLSWFTNSNIEITPADTGPYGATQLSPAASLALRLNIVVRDQSERQGSVIFRADFTNSSGGVSSEFGSLAVTPGSLEPAEGIIDAQISASLKTLTEKQPGQLYLILKNKADVSVSVNSLVVRTPSFLVARGFPHQFSIAPREVTTIPIVIKAPDGVRPGKHQVILDLGMLWPGSGKTPRHLVLSREVDVGVEGESAILAAFGIPSFLILPGFLMVVTFGALWKWRLLRPRTASKDLQVSPKDPEFWLFAITLSGLMAIVYPRLFPKRDYLELYGLRDVARVWIISIGVGITFYLLYASVKQWRQRIRTPTANDDAVTILEKLARQDLSLLVLPVTVGSEKAFALEAMPPESSTIMVGPAIEWKWIGGNNEAIQEKIYKWIVSNDAGALGKEFRSRLKTGDVALSFKPRDGGTITRPTKVDYKDVKPNGSAEQILLKD